MGLPMLEASPLEGVTVGVGAEVGGGAGRLEALLTRPLADAEARLPETRLPEALGRLGRLRVAEARATLRPVLG
jgi:hypothetical protein